MARFKYISTSGEQRSIEAPDAQSALTSAVDIAPGSGVVLETQFVSPVTNNGVDLSLVGNVGAIVPVPVIPPPVAISTPFVAPTPEIEQPTVMGGLRTNIDAVRGEIAVIEARLANQSTELRDSLEHANVFTDMRALNRLNAELRIAQDREIEIPIEQRQRLRGRLATTTEFAQATRPELERAALQELVASRSATRLSESINTNIQIVNTKIKADTDRDNFIYQQKQDYLKTLETNYANIITEEQKFQLEERKFQNELTRDEINAERTARQKQLDLAAERGATPAEMSSLLDGSLDDIYGWNAENAPIDEKAAENLAVQQSAIDVVNLIDGILLNESGLKDSVGSTRLGKTRVGNVFGLVPSALGIIFEEVTGITGTSDKIATFRGSAGKLVSETILQTLIDLKGQGATLGAISEAELALLTNAATDLRPVTDSDGKPTGQFNVSEERFKEVVELMQTASMKVYIASKLGKEAYAQANYLNASQGDIRKTYDALIGIDTSQQSKTNFYQKDLIPVLDVLRREEGFREKAYKDSTGTWTIGYGNTTINGRPVRSSDRVTREEGERMLRESVAQTYSSGVRLVGVPLTKKQIAGLTSFEYNLGPGIWETRTGKRILEAISSGNFVEAGNLMQRYNKSRSPSTGELELNPVLRERRAREAALLLS